jgi:hypothetical protein
MRKIVSEKAKSRKTDKKRLQKYWELVEPKEYAKEMVAKKK